MARLPAPGATNVWSRDPITIAFDKKMDALSFTDQTVVMAASGGISVPKLMSLSAEGLLLTITPLSMPVPSEITVVLTSGIRDAAGNALVVPAGTWQWALPAWQSLGYAPYFAHWFDSASLAFDDSGTIYIAMAFRNMSYPVAKIYSWHNGWSNELWSRNYGEAVAIAADAAGEVALAWYQSPEAMYGLLSSDNVLRGSAGGWEDSVSFRQDNESVVQNRMRYDGEGRLVVAWTSSSSWPVLDVKLHVKRFESGMWRQIGSDPVATWTPPPTNADGWDLSFNSAGEPSIVFDSLPSSAGTHLLSVLDWDGSSWRTSLLTSSSLTEASDPAWPIFLRTAQQEAFVSWLDTTPLSFHPFRVYVARAHDVVPLGDVLFNLPAISESPVTLGKNGLPVAVWVEGRVLCGKQWDGTAWQKLASDALCTGNGSGIPAAVRYGGANMLAACVSDSSSNPDRWPQLLCYRYNEYVLQTAPVPLTSILINDAHGASTTIPNPVVFQLAYTPPNATDKSLSWKICTAQPSACSPDPTGHCRTCTTSTALGSMTSTGVYTPPASVATSPSRVYVLACQGQICDWSNVDVYR